MVLPSVDIRSSVTHSFAVNNSGTEDLPISIRFANKDDKKDREIVLPAGHMLVPAGGEVQVPLTFMPETVKTVSHKIVVEVFGSSEDNISVEVITTGKRSY